MRCTYKICCEAAKEATNRCRYYIFKCNKRNGYIAIDVYSRVTSKMLNFEYCGTAKEVFTYLSGAINMGLKIYQL